MFSLPLAGAAANHPGVPFLGHNLETPMDKPLPDRLKAIREQIDAIDEAVHRLLVERSGVIAELIRVKGTSKPGAAFRPDRHTDGDEHAPVGSRWHTEQRRGDREQHGDDGDRSWDEAATSQLDHLARRSAGGHVPVDDGGTGTLRTVSSTNDRAAASWPPVISSTRCAMTGPATAWMSSGAT